MIYFLTPLFFVSMFAALGFYVFHKKKEIIINIATNLMILSLFIDVIFHVLFSLHSYTDKTRISIPWITINQSIIYSKPSIIMFRSNILIYYEVMDTICQEASDESCEGCSTRFLSPWTVVGGQNRLSVMLLSLLAILNSQG